MSPKKAGGLFFLIIVLHLAAELLLGAASERNPAVLDLVPSTLISEGLILWPMLIFALLTPADFSQMLPMRGIGHGNIVRAVLLVVCAYPSILLANSLSMLFVDNTVEQMSGEILRTPFPVTLILIGIFGPVCEELVFRGYLFRSFRSAGSVCTSVLLSAFLFGLMHLNLNQAMYAFAMGIFLALAADACGSLCPAILMHILFNSFEVCLLYLTASADTSGLTGALTEADSGAMTMQDFAMTAVFAAAGIAGAVFLIRGMKRSTGRRTAVQKPDAGITAVSADRPAPSFLLILGIIISIITIIFIEIS